mgnify:CR=1 FL=1
MVIPDSHITLLIDQTSSESVRHAKGGTLRGLKTARHWDEGFERGSKQPCQPVGTLPPLRSQEGSVESPMRLLEVRPNIASG